MLKLICQFKKLMFGLDLLLQAGWWWYRKTVWKMWWLVCDLWLLCAQMWWVSLWPFSGGVWWVEALESAAHHYKECAIQEKDRNGCSKTAHLGSSRTDLFYGHKKIQLQEEVIGAWSLPPPSTTSRKAWRAEHRPNGLAGHWHLPTLCLLFSRWSGGNGKGLFTDHSADCTREGNDRFSHGFSWMQKQDCFPHW